MKIWSAVMEGTDILKNKSILSAQLDTEILMSKAINKNREYIILNHDEALNKENIKYFKNSSRTSNKKTNSLYFK